MKAVITFGRMNPPTVGHEKLVKKLLNVASKEKGTAMVFLSHSQDRKKNPLPYKLKIKYAKDAFGPKVVRVSGARNIIEILKQLEVQLYDEVVLVVGSDRVKEFETLLNKYNGKEYSFDSIKVVSAGDRDPDAEGVSGMSASKMRKAVATGDFASFKQGVPKGINATAMFKEIGSYMGIKHKLKERGVSEAVEELSERKPLTVAQRRVVGRRMKRLAPRMKRRREILKKKMADNPRLQKRARKAAIKLLRKKFAGKQGANYANLPPASKIAIDRMIEKKRGSLGTLEKRLLPKIRKAEMERLKRVRGGGQVNESTTPKGAAHLKPSDPVTDDYLGYLSDFYKEVMGFRPRDLMQRIKTIADADAMNDSLVRTQAADIKHGRIDRKLRKHARKAEGRMKKRRSFGAKVDPGAAMKAALKKAGLKVESALQKKADNHDVPLEIVEEVFMRGLNEWTEDTGKFANQYAFDRVNSFLTGGEATDLDADLFEAAENITGWQFTVIKPFEVNGTTYRKGKQFGSSNPAENRAWASLWKHLGVTDNDEKVNLGRQNFSTKPYKKLDYDEFIKGRRPATGKRRRPDPEPLKEARKTPLQKLKDFDQSRVAAGKKAIFDKKKDNLNLQQRKVEDDLMGRTPTSFNKYKKRYYNEDVDTLDEVSYDKLRRYVDDADYHKRKKGRALALNKMIAYNYRHEPKKSARYIDVNRPELTPKPGGKFAPKVMAGAPAPRKSVRPNNRIRKEDVDTLDEISYDTLRRYADGAEYRPDNPTEKRRENRKRGRALALNKMIKYNNRRRSKNPAKYHDPDSPGSLHKPGEGAPKIMAGKPKPKKRVRSAPPLYDHVMREEGGAGEFGTSKLRRQYEKNTPGIREGDYEERTRQRIAREKESDKRKHDQAVLRAKRLDMRTQRQKG